MDPITRAEHEMSCAVLSDMNSFRNARHILPGTMVDPGTRALWTVIHGELSEGRSIAPLTLWHSLDGFEAGRHFLKNYPTPDHLKTLWLEGSLAGDTKALSEAVLARHMEHQLNVTLVRPRSGDAMLQANAILSEIRHLISDQPNTDVSVDDALSALEAAMSDIKWKYENPNSNLGWKTGDDQLDKLFKSLSGGFKSDKMVVMSALTNHGKSLMLLKLCLEFVNTVSDDFQRTPNVLYITTEMSVRSVMGRMLSYHGKINTADVNGLDPDYMKKAAGAEQVLSGLLNSQRLYISQQTNVDTIIRETSRLRHADKIDIVIIDYIGGLTGGSHKDKASSYMYAGEIAQSLQALAIDLEIPVITANQLNRGAYEGGMPTLQNVADSSKISHVANLMGIIWRPDQNNKLINASNVALWKDVVCVGFPKNRDAAKDTKMMYYHLTSFGTLAPVGVQKRKELNADLEKLLSHS